MQQLSRIKARENAFLSLFSASFGVPVDEAAKLLGEEEPAHAVDAFGLGLLENYQQYEDEIDNRIESYLKGWKVNRLSKTNLAILRLAIAEMCYGSEEDMDSVVINEAVELAKRYGSDEDYQFVNGLLGALSRDKEQTGSSSV